MTYSFQVVDPTGTTTDATDTEFVNNVYEKKGGRYGFSIGFMGHIYKALDLAGVLDHDTPHLPWPRENTEAEADDELLVWTRLPEFRAVLEARSPNRYQVPAFKLRSNDPWLITPDECFIIAYALRGHPDPDIAHFGAYCAWARSRGGFRVG